MAEMLQLIHPTLGWTAKYSHESVTDWWPVQYYTIPSVTDMKLSVHQLELLWFRFMSKKDLRIEECVKDIYNKLLPLIKLDNTKQEFIKEVLQKYF